MSTVNSYLKTYIMINFFPISPNPTPNWDY